MFLVWFLHGSPRIHYIYNHNMVGAFGFPAEAELKKNFLTSLCRMLNLDQHVFWNENNRSIRCLSGIYQGHREATGHSWFWPWEFDTLFKGQSSLQWHLDYICFFPEGMRGKCCVISGIYTKWPGIMANFLICLKNTNSSGCLLG